MEKPIQLQQQQQQQQQQPHEALKCPRCDSSNTKFCYYNNYSLSQPRHFCKACKRYWTRGGTLRNVPVGGGCRKNKRVKKPITTTTVHVAATPASVNRHTNPNPNPNLDHNPIPSSTTSNGNSNHHLNPLFYGLLPQNPNYPRYDVRVNSSLNEIAGYDHVQPHISASGLGFTSTGETGSLVANHCHNSGLSFSSFMNSSMYCSSSTSLNQPQRFMGFAAYDGNSMVKDLKMEETQNRIMEWDTNTFHDQNKNDQTQAVVSSYPNSVLWDTEGGGWLDPTNHIGSSVPSMI